MLFWIYTKGLTKEAVDDCETLDCLSDIVSNGNFNLKI